MGKEVKKKVLDIRDRIVDFKRIKGEEIEVNGRNFRTHPQAQREVLRGILRQIGMAGALLTYRSERNGGRLTLIDGELRTTDNPKLKWPTLITDLNDEEADLLLATHDPLSAMATRNDEALSLLVSDIDASGAAVQAFLEGLGVEAATQPNGASTPSENRLKKHIIPLVKVVVACPDLAVVEAALVATGKINRGEALKDVCQSYLDEKGQLDIQTEDSLAELFN